MKRLALTFLSIFLAAASTADAGSAKPLPAINEAPNYSNTQLDASNGAMKIFDHFVSECSPKGTVLFLATLKDGRHMRLTLLDANEAKSYIETDGEGKYPWMLACDGPEKFLVEKDQSYAGRAAKVSLYKGRALEGIDYATTRSTASDATAVARAEEGYSEKIATDLASYKMSFVSTHLGTRFEGRYEAAVGPCDMVSVKRVDPDTATMQSFKVCSGSVYPLTGPIAMNTK